MTDEEINNKIQEEVSRQMSEFVVNFDKNIFTERIKIMDGRNILLGQATGTKIGTETTQKLSFYGSTPIVQGSKIADPTGGATVDSECRTQLRAVIDALEAIGITSAT